MYFKRSKQINVNRLNFLVLNKDENHRWKLIPTK